jgi:hypothetical protein
VVRPWAEAELALLRDTSLSLAEVAERTGRPLQTVARRRQLRGIQSVKVNREWTDSELSFLRDRGLSLRTVAELTGRTHGACRRKADLLHVGSREQRIGRAAEFSVAEDELLRELNWQASVGAMADALGRSEVAVTKRLHRLGLRDGFPTGEQHHWWQGGVSQNPAYGWRGEDWAEVRSAVFERDGYSCQDGGEFIPSARGLVVHHVIPWRFRPVNDLRWLVTLCVSHHMQRPEHQWTEIPDCVARQLTDQRGDEASARGTASR